MTESIKDNEDSLLKDLKLSLRLDDDQEDSTILNRNLTAAEAYVKGAVGNDDDLMTGFYDLDKVKTLYEIVVISIASAYYTYRSANMTGRANTVDLTSNAIIGQLRAKYELEKQERESNGSEH